MTGNDMPQVATCEVASQGVLDGPTTPPPVNSSRNKLQTASLTTSTIVPFSLFPNFCFLSPVLSDFAHLPLHTW